MTAVLERPKGRVRRLIVRPTFTVSAVIVVFWVVMGLGWSLFGFDPFSSTGEKLAAPSLAHPFGTDQLSRDVFARVMAGAEPALRIGPVGTLIATVLGSALGIIAGYFRGWADAVLMRSFDVLLALPTMLLVLIIVGAGGSSPGVLALTVGIVFAPGIARIVRAAVLVEAGKDYLASSRLQGERTWRILFVEVVPNILPTIIVQATLSLSAAIFITSTLSFLGLASEPPSPDWGLAINENRVYLQTAWWTAIFPALGIASLVVSVTLLADNLKEVYER